MAYDVFISYSRKDAKIADEICTALSAAGLTFFIDKEGIEAGQNFPQVLAEAVESSTIFLFLASQHSFQSRFTRGEVTYAFNHKHSGAIIPYIIDGSESMPPDLELMLGNFNWRRKELCPIQTGLIDDIRKAIAHPEEGTVGGRQVLSSRKKKVLVWSLVSLLALLVAGAVVFALMSGRDRQDNKEALSASRLYEDLIGQSDALIQQADALKDSSRSLESTGEQIASLQQAGLLLDSAVGKEMESRSARVQAKLDSMAASWADYAKESYALYRISHRESERENVLSCIGYVLSIRPDPELENIKKQLSL